MSDLPVVEPPFVRVGSTGPTDAAAGSTGSTDAAADGDPPTARVAGVVLAAGTSSRYGDRNKLLESVGGEPMVRRAVRTLLEAHLDPVVVVLGHEADRVRAALADLDVAFVENPDYDEGQATSVAAGVRALSSDVDAALFALGDMPWVAVETVERLLAAYTAGAGTAIAAAHEGVRGNPVLWDARHFQALTEQTGDVGGRDLLYAVDGAVLVETGDPGTRRDVDRPSDRR